MSKQNTKHIADILAQLKKQEVYSTESGFSSDKEAIRKLFKLTKENEKESYLLRLTVIDSMYSTQMNRRYYGLEELAEALYTIQGKSDKSLPDMFLEYLKTKDASLFDYTDIRTKEKTNLFSEKYGIGKNGKDKGLAISLISKYAYFATDYRFPIYDSIACEMYPLVWKYCGFSGKPAKLKVHQKGTTVTDGIATMKAYVEAIDKLIDLLGGNISYDHLDRLLWFVGKIRRGNLSLVLSRQEFEWCAKHLKKEETYNGEFKFDIESVELNELKFLKKDTLLYLFFDLAKDLAKDTKNSTQS